ncbi:hypothetical protein [Profundibacter sp.]
MPKPMPEVLTTCSECGLTYVSGLSCDDHYHNITHHKCVTTLRPVPSRALKAALSKDPETVWVTVLSPRWLRLMVHRRALAFKREFRYDFIQWDASDDPHAIAYLFSDDNCRVVGACCFRLGASEQPEKWELDWVWLCPEARRQGWLSKHWGIFREKFGEFSISVPISEEMQGFLRKRGLDHLIR